MKYLLAYAMAASVLLILFFFILNHLVVFIVCLIFPDVSSASVSMFVRYMFFLTGMVVIWVYLFFFIIYFKARKHEQELGIINPRIHPRLSIIVPAYNEEDSIGECIRSILEQDYPRELLEVIVVDDGSRDLTYKIAEWYSIRYPFIKVVRHIVNLGKAEALWTGIRQARGDFIAIIDADTKLASRNTLSRMVYLLEMNDEAGCVTGIVEPASSRPNMVITLQELEYLFGINFGRRVQSFMGWLLIVPGSLSLYRGYVLRSLARAPDDTLAEDFDLTITTIKKGLKAVFDPYFRSYTKPAVSFRELYKQRLRWYYGGLQVLAKHRDILLNRRYGAVGIASFFYTLLIEYGLPFLQVAGYIVFPLILVLQGILHVEFIGLPLTGLPLLFAYLLVLFLQYIPGYIMSWILLLVEKKGLGARRLFASLIYFTFYNIFQAVVKVVSVIKYLYEEKVVWR